MFLVELIRVGPNKPNILIEVGKYSESLEVLAFTIAKNFLNVKEVKIYHKGKGGESIESYRIV